MRPTLLVAFAALCAPVLHAGASEAASRAWNEEARTLGYQIDAFDKCRGRMAEKPRFSGCVKMWEDAYRRLNRMDMQAAAELARDSGSAQARDRVDRTGTWGGRLDAAVAFFQPEVRKLGRAQVHRFVASEKLLAKYRAPLDAVLAAKPGAPVDARALWKD